MKHKLIYYGNPILREKAKPVEKIDDFIFSLVEEMIAIMEEAHGVGLAAPQVGLSLSLFISNIDFEDDAGEIHFCKPRVFINPILTNPSPLMVDRSEGCLSIPGLTASIIRPYAIDVEAMDLEGKIFHLKAERLLARCMMHEKDHLDGILFIDRLKGKKRSELEPELKKIKQKYRPL